MNSDVCGFCRRGKEVNDVCGKLYSTKTIDNGPVTAHRKCMQYASNLAQYSYSHFGGFDVDEVFEEYKRGCKLRCYICRDTNVVKNKKKNLHTRGAAAGCAIVRCPLSFHFYCAARSNDAVVKKLRRKNGERDNYMTFCNSNHEQLFRKNNTDYTSCEESSESETDDSGHSKQYSVNNSDDEVGDGGGNRIGNVDAYSGGSREGDDNDDDDDDDDDIISCTIETNNKMPEVNHKYLNKELTHTKVESDSDGASSDGQSGKEENPQNGDATTSSDSDEEVTPTKKYKRIVTNTSGSPGKKRSGVQTNNNHSPGNGIGSVSPGKKRSACYSHSGGSTSTPRRRKEEITNEGQRSCHSPQKKKKADTTFTGFKPLRYDENQTKSSSKSPKGRSEGRVKGRDSTPVSRRLPECAVCISEGPLRSAESAKRLHDVISQQHDMSSYHVFIWQLLEHSIHLPQYNTLAFLKDLVQHVLDNDLSEVDKLLFDPKYLKTKDKTEYEPQASLLKDMGEILETEIWSKLDSQSDSIGGVREVDGKRNLILLLNDRGIDCDGKLRRKLGMAEESVMFRWTGDVHITADEDMEMSHLEKDTIVAWIEENIPVVSRLYIHPIEQTLKPKSDGISVTDSVASHIKEDQTVGRHTVLVFKQVDTEVVNFQPYCRKAVRNILPSCVRTRHGLTVIMDTQSLGVEDVHHQLRDIFRDDEGKLLPITIQSAFDPSSVPVSCVVVEVCFERLTDKMKNGQVTARRKKSQTMSTNNGQTPSTSK